MSSVYSAMTLPPRPLTGTPTMSEIWTLRRALRAGPVLLAVLLAASLSAMAATSEPDSAGPASPSSAPLHFGGGPSHDLAQDRIARMATQSGRPRAVLPPDPGDPRTR